jgi:hypothetical protein
LSKLHNNWQPGESEDGHHFAHILQLIEIWISYHSGTLMLNQEELVQVIFTNFPLQKNILLQFDLLAASEGISAGKFLLSYSD